jgi:two-component system response regulator FlrC
LGGQSVIQLNVRIVAATNKDLKKAITDREFREDLYYRIATFRMRLLPLAERPGDIIPLAMQCLLQHDKKPWQLHPQAQALLLQYPWPGNVRELENVMRRAMVLCTDHVVTPAHLMFDDWLTASTAALAPVTLPAAPDVVLQETNSSHLEQFMAAAKNNLGLQEQDTVENPDSLPTDLHSAARMNEHQVIMATLASTPSKSEAAKRLGISPRTLRYKMAQLREHGLAMASAC